MYYIIWLQYLSNFEHISTFRYLLFFMTILILYVCNILEGYDEWKKMLKQGILHSSMIMITIIKK